MAEEATNLHAIARRTLEIIPFVMRVMTAEMRSSQLDIAPSQMGLLGMLTLRPYTLGELARQMAVSAPTMSNTITVLEARGWVTRERDRTDRRVVYVALSSEGRQMLGAIDHYTAERISEYLAPLDDRQRQTLLEGLTLLQERFIAAMDGQFAPPDAAALKDTAPQTGGNQDQGKS